MLDCNHEILIRKSMSRPLRLAIDGVTNIFNFRNTKNKKLQSLTKSKMESRLQPCISLPLPEDLLADIVEKAKDWSLMHGVGMRSKTKFSNDSLVFAPFTLVPSAFPREEYDKAVNLQPTINKLVHKVAHNHEFLKDSLKNTIKVDDFTGRLYKIYDDVRKEGFRQCVSLGLLRSDYLCQSFQRNSIKQVEVNTIASSFGGIATRVFQYHRYILQELGYSDLLKNCPENNSLQGLCEGMVAAWKLFGNPKAAILFVVENITYNICDQRFHEFEIRRMAPGISVIRKTLTQINNSGVLSPNKDLVVNGETVAVVYFRAGYEPGHYMSEREWDARLLMERSSAIKCPSIHYHLAGTKKVQQALAAPGCLENFLSDSKEVEAVRAIFTGLYSLDYEEETSEKAVEMALAEPQRYVLKPQREGGGNNVYGDNIRTTIAAIRDSQERSAWILMDRIVPPIQANYIIRPDQPITYSQDIVCELGIFGVIIGDEKTIHLNRHVGHMMRSKLKSVDEGGVAAGLGALDSPYLT